MFQKFGGPWLPNYAYDCLAALPATDVCVQQSHAAKRLLLQCSIQQFLIKSRLYKKNVYLKENRNVNLKHDIWMQIHEMKRWAKYWFTFSSFSKVSSAAWTLIFGSLFHCSWHFIWQWWHTPLMTSLSNLGLGVQQSFCWFIDNAWFANNSSLTFSVLASLFRFNMNSKGKYYFQRCSKMW